MYGNKTLPGISVSPTFRNEGGIWRGAPEATWFKIANVSGSGDEPAAIQAGTIMKEDASTGAYTPINAAEIASLSGVKLAIVADYTAQSGTSEADSQVLIGVSGQVDKAKLYIGEKCFTELTDEQKISLNSKLEASGFLLVNVIQG